MGLAKKLGCSIQAIRAQVVGIADENQLLRQLVCKVLIKYFKADVMLISLGGMVLGVQWWSSWDLFIGISKHY